MGRWAQARRRGGGGPRGVGLGAPPAPTLSVQEGEVVSGNTGSANSGGEMVLYESAFAVGPWVELDRRAWGYKVTWGDAGFLGGRYLTATEVGNGTAYTGESVRSSVLDLT